MLMHVFLRGFIALTVEAKKERAHILFVLIVVFVVKKIVFSCYSGVPLSHTHEGLIHTYVFKRKCSEGTATNDYFISN